VVACPLFLPDRDPEASFPSICIVARREMRHAHMVPVHPDNCMTEVHVAPLRLSGRGHVQRLTRQANGEHLAPQPLLPSASGTHSSPIFFLLPCVCECERERTKRVFHSKKVGEKYPAQGGEPVDSELRWTVLFATLVDGAG